MKVVVVVARGLQPGMVGCYGNLWVDTPALDRLAAEGVVFDQHFADRADPEGARRAWRSGRYDLPAPADQRPPASGAGSDLLASLRQGGIHTRLIVDASRPAPAEFEAGWDAVERPSPREEESPLGAVLDAARAALTELAERDGWLLWVELATPLPPWDVPDEFQGPYFREDAEEDEEDGEGGGDVGAADEPLTPLREVAPGPIDPTDDALFLRLHSTYAAAITWTDAAVGELTEAACGPGRDDVLLVVTSDCGQSLGEHGVVGPVRPWLHDEVVHLPLLLRLPGADEAGRRVPALTQAVDLAPTLADVFEVPLPGAHGNNLLPLVYGEAEQVRPYACAGLEVAGAVEWALRAPSWAFLLPVQRSPDSPGRAPQLYVKPDDRWEVNNVLQHHLELTEHLEQTLRDFVVATRRPGPLVVPELPDLGEAAAPGAEEGSGAVDDAGSTGEP